MGLIEKKEIESVEDIKKDLLDVIDCLADYKDSGLTSDQVMELSEAVGKLERYFEDKITVNQVIDFFVDFYIAQGDDGRVEAAELLTNEEVERYKRLKERDTAKSPMYEGDGYSDEEMVYDTWICPNCGKKYEVDYDDYKHCPECGQAIDENLEGMKDE